MPRRQSSSRSSASSVEIINQRSSNKFRDRSRSTSTSSRESIRKSKKSSRKSRKSRSRSPKYAGPKNKISELDKERTKDYDFTDEVNELHSNEKFRQKVISKLDESEGFKPQSFKSSRSDKKKNEPSRFKSSSAIENTMFGSATSLSESMTRNADLLLNSNMVNSSNKSIMSDLFFEDSKIRQNRWRIKVKEILESR